MVGNIDYILTTLNRHQVDYLLIGGVNFLFRHTPVLTYDIDVWIEDMPDNRGRCEAALVELQAEWGITDDDWGPVAAKRPGWLDRRSVLCLISPHGAIDVFRSVAGLTSWSSCRERAEAGKTVLGTGYFGLCDADMLECQLALPTGQRNDARIHYLTDVLRKGNDASASGP
jgi:hypothetical protein